MNLLKLTRYNIYKLYYKLVRGCKWDPKRDFITPYASLIKHNASVSRINELRKKVYLSTITIVEKGYYDIKDICVKLDSNEVAVNSIFYSEKFEVNSIKGIGCDTIIKVVNSDSIEEGIRLLDLGYNPAILNMANRHYPGGGTTNGSIGQEEDIFRRTNIYRSLYQYAPIGKRFKIEMSKHQYPMDRNYGAVYSPGITIFRKDAQNGYALMEQPRMAAFISVAGINHPTLTSEGMIDEAHIEMIKNKIRTILRIGLQNGHDSLVLGALGCGAFCNPPQHIALLFHEVLNEDEFVNKYKYVSFAILEDPSSFQKHNKQGNLKCFEQQFN